MTATSAQRLPCTVDPPRPTERGKFKAMPKYIKNRQVLKKRKKEKVIIIMNTNKVYLSFKYLTTKINK